MNKKTLTEQEVRTRLITPGLQQAGWKLWQIREEYYFTAGRMHIQGRTAVRGRRHFADYVLIHNNVQLALIEAKDSTHSVGSGMQQALRYAEALDIPFVYSSNGYGFLEHDRLSLTGQIERELLPDEFPSPDDLWERYTYQHELTSEQEDIVTQPYFSMRGGKIPRYYQRVAIDRSVRAVAQGRNRILLVMATGTGKTYTAFQIIWRLWQAGKSRRVLFLADRNILVDQAKTNDFKHFGDVMTKIQHREIDKAYEMYLALYQQLTGPEEWQKVYREFSPDFFDLIIVDECHRGSAAEDSVWREVLEYFSSAVQIGMTATPKETEYVSNIDYFGEPVYIYSLKQGIEDGFLAPYKVIRVDVDKDIDGWMPAPGQTDKYGNPIEKREYTWRDWDRNIVIEQRNRLVAERVAEYLRDTDPYAKTIVFCVDIDHAERMRQYLVNALGGEARTNSKYVMRLTGDDPRARYALDEFIDPQKRYPVVATTSKLLTTGVDVQTCELIVLDTVINALSEFKQIIGRGTRLRPDLGKTHFTIMDFRRATRLFYDPQFDGEPVQVYEPDDGEPITPPASVDEPRADDEDGATAIRVVDDVPVEILRERVQYYDTQNNLITKSFVEFSRDNVRKVYKSLDDFLQTWKAADRKQEVLAELMERGVLLDYLEVEVGAGYDPFDLICHVAFDLPLLTRQQRAGKAKQALADEYSETAREVLAALLDKYAEDGIDIIEQATDRAQAQRLLEVPPFHQFGTPYQIAERFGGQQQFFGAVEDLDDRLYQVEYRRAA